MVANAAMFNMKAKGESRNEGEGMETKKVAGRVSQSGKEHEEKEDKKQDDKEDIEKAQKNPKKSFAGNCKGEKHSNSKDKNNQQPNSPVLDNVSNLELFSKDNSDWLMNLNRMLLRELRTFQSIKNIERLCKEEGFLDAKLSYIGGLWF